VINCGAIKESVFQYFQSETEVVSTKQACIVSLPLKGLDGANAEVFVEEVNNGALLIHDGGKTVGHLESSGLIVTESRLATLADLASRLGATLDNGVFKALAKADTVQVSALAVGQCCSMALFELLGHVPFSEEEQIRAKVTNEVEQWSESSGISVKAGVKMPGSIKQYKIDFIADAPTPVQVNILIPTYSSTVSADRYALQVLDLTSSLAGEPRRLAILAKPERWTRPARARVGLLADQIAEVTLGDTLLPTGITEALNILSAAA
jgi:hypothetical protein